MAELAGKYKDQLKRIKKNVDKAFIYFKENNERYHKFIKFVNQTALSSADESTLHALQKPVIEFNITNAPISRLCGEYSKQEPSIEVSAENGTQVDPEMLAVIEGHYRHILWDAYKHNTQFRIYKDQLEGGFSALKVYTEYANEMSFDQEIRLRRVYEPTFVGFDPMSRETTKSDAEWYFELFPMPLADFERDYPDVDVYNLTFMQGNGLTWSYSQGSCDNLIVCDYYEKKKKKKKIVKLANQQVMLADKYEEFLQQWEEQGILAPAPEIIDERVTTVAYFCRYRLIETEVIDYDETDFKYPSHIFVDGDSVILKDGEGEGNNGQMKQFTKPYIYHAHGHQRLVNFAGQVIANDMENMVQHKFMVAQEALPQQEEFLEAYKNVQVASVLVHQAYMDGDPDKPLPAPQPIPHIPLPPDVMGTFNNCMQMLQNILGSYDASLGIQQQQLSGVAIVEGATQSNAAAMPYIVNNMAALNQAAQVIINLIPKIFVTPRSIPIINKEGQREFVLINQPGGVSLQYDENALHVRVEAGVSFAIAKNKALQQIIALMQASPLFAQFINQEGLDVLLDNVEFRGVDVVKEKAKQFMEQVKQQQAQAQQMEQQKPNAQLIAAQAAQMNAQANMVKAQAGAQENQLKQQENQMNAQVKVAEIEEQREKSENDITVALIKAAAEDEKAQNQMTIALVEALRKNQDQEHTHLKDILELNKSLNEPTEPSKTGEK